MLSKKDPNTPEGNWALQIKHRVKQNPAQVLGLTECEAHMEMFLKTPAPLDPADPAQSDLDPQSRRKGFEYLCLRGRENSSCLLGARAHTASRIELIEWHRIRHGKYQGTIAYSRTMLVRIWSDSVGGLGEMHRCRIVHLHRNLAKGIWPTKLEEFWDWLAVAARSMEVLMGDFNMSLFLVIPELRKRGVTIDLAAWFPYKQPDCTPIVDSCAIFFINRPGLYQLNKGREALHANNPLGIYWDTAANDAAVAAGEANGTGDFVVMDKGGPGFPFTSYLPKKDEVYPYVMQTLTPSLADEEELDRLAKDGRLWKIKEKRLGLKEFTFHDKSSTLPTIQKGAHYPLCAFTCNPGRRSPGRARARAERWSSRRGAGKGEGARSEVVDAGEVVEQERWSSRRGQGWGKDAWQGDWQQEGRSRGWLDEGRSSWQDEGQGWRKDAWQGDLQSESRSRRWQNEGQSSWQDEGQGWRTDARQGGWQSESRSRGWQNGGQSTWQNEWQSLR